MNVYQRIDDISSTFITFTNCVVFELAASGGFLIVSFNRYSKSQLVTLSGLDIFSI